MKNGIAFFLLLVLPGCLLGSSAEGVETDILPRTINFLIFVAIIYYLLADKIKSFFSERTLSVQVELEKVQTILNESKVRFENAQLELDNSKLIASQVVADAQSDVLRIEQNVAKVVSEEIQALSKHFDEKISIETRKAKKEVVSEVLDVMLRGDNIGLSDRDMTNIILKKVA